jgi:two-component system, cell cycle response regulator DivK
MTGLSFSANKMSTLCMFPHLVHPLTSGLSMRSLRVLLAEDDDDLRALYGYMLAAAGYKVNAVRNGLQALAEIQVNRPDVVVTDITMPVLSGLDLIVAVRSNDELADLPVVAITSFGEDICKLARAAGATDAIAKPTEIVRMREVIDAAVTRPSSARLSLNRGSLSKLSDKNHTTGATPGPATIPPRTHPWN